MEPGGAQGEQRELRSVLADRTSLAQLIAQAYPSLRPGAGSLLLPANDVRVRLLDVATEPRAWRWVLREQSGEPGVIFVLQWKARHEHRVGNREPLRDGGPDPLAVLVRRVAAAAKRQPVRLGSHELARSAALFTARARSRAFRLESSALV